MRLTPIKQIPLLSVLLGMVFIFSSVTKLVGIRSFGQTMEAFCNTEMESTTYLSCELTSLDECVFDCDKSNIHIKAVGDLKGEHKHSYN